MKDIAKQMFRPLLDKGDFFQFKEMKLCWFILEPVASMVYHATDKAEALDRLSDGQKALYYWWFLENQSMGIFKYFFKNGYYEYLPKLLRGMEVVNHKEVVQILKGLLKEIKIIDDGYEISEEVLEESFDKYNRISKEIPLHLEKYIRANPNNFLVDENGGKIKENLAGHFQTYFSTGQLKNQFSMKSGVLDGDFKVFSKKGILLKAESYEQGIRKDYTHYKKNGLKEQELRFLKEGLLNVKYDEKGYAYEEFFTDDRDKKNGFYRHYFYNTGILKSEKNYKNGRYHGPFKEYYKNGQLQAIGEYINHKRKTESCWDKQGNQTIINGEGYIIYEDEEGTERTVTSYKNGRANGKYYVYRNGKLAYFRTYQDGEMTGEAKYYDEEGNLMKEEVLKNGCTVSFKVYKLAINFNDFVILLKPQIPSEDYPEILKILGLASAQYKGDAPKKDIADNRVPGVYISQINGTTLIMGFEALTNWDLRTTTFTKKEKELANLYPKSTLFFINHFESPYREAFHYIKNGTSIRVYEAYDFLKKINFDEGIPLLEETNKTEKYYNSVDKHHAFITKMTGIVYSELPWDFEFKYFAID